METWRNFTIEEIYTAISDELGSERLDTFVADMIMDWDLPKEYDASDFENCFAPSRLYADVIYVLFGMTGMILGYRGIREMCKK